MMKPEQATGFLRDFYDWLWTGEIEAKIYEASELNLQT